MYSLIDIRSRLPILNETKSVSEFFPMKIQFEVIKSRRRAARGVGQAEAAMDERKRVSFEIKRKSPLASLFSSLHQSQLYPLSSPAIVHNYCSWLYPSARSCRLTRYSAREKEEEEGNVGAASEMESTIDFWHRDYCKTPCVEGGGRNLEKKKVPNPSGRSPETRRGNGRAKPPSSLKKTVSTTPLQAHQFLLGRSDKIFCRRQLKRDYSGTSYIQYTFSK